MSWNSPDNEKDRKDPWSGKQKAEGPPDLVAALGQLRRFLLGKKTYRPTTGGGPSLKGMNPPPLSNLVGLLVGFCLVLWILSGIFIVGPADEAVVLRWGKYQETLGPGPHWILRPVETEITSNVQKLWTFRYAEEMLTRDENIVDVAVTTRYRVNNLRDYLFLTANPDGAVQQATASALRQVVGRMPLDKILTTGREYLRQEVEKQLRHIIEGYSTGILITDLTLQPASAPKEVKEAFDDAIKAREDRESYIKYATAYANERMAMAKGKVQRISLEADAYKSQVIAQAKGAASRFKTLLPLYQQSPQVMKERLYLDAMQSVLSKTSKVLVDVGSHNAFFLPLDKMLDTNSATKQTADVNAPKHAFQALTAAEMGAPDKSLDDVRLGRLSQDRNSIKRDSETYE